MTFTQHKSLRKSFWRITVDENDLARLASIIRNTTSAFEGEVEIEILSADGEDKYRSNDPNFFFDENLPRVISDVRISFHHYKSPISCNLRFSTGINGLCELSVDGKDTTIVAGLFRELSREIDSKTSLGVWWAKHMDSIWVSILTGFITSAAIYCFFDFLLFIADRSFNDFIGSNIRSAIVTIGWFCISIGFFIGGSYVEKFLKRCLPVVRFRGRISDAGSISRSRLIWVASALIIPILLNVFSSLISDFFSRISKG